MVFGFAAFGFFASRFPFCSPFAMVDCSREKLQGRVCDTTGNPNRQQPETPAIRTAKLPTD
ncbi:hypothetical protein WCLP8_5400009 [uncultured Gammaproteobacteria bacterium]